LTIRDRIISRTLAYGLLTPLLGGGYAGVVLELSQLLGRDSSLGVAVATLALAAVFQPTRRRIQRAVDRRFNRRRYDTAQTIQAFSARLRQQVDLDTLTARAAGGGRPDHAANPGVAVAAAFGQCAAQPARHRRIPHDVTADGSLPAHTHRFVKQARTTRVPHPCGRAVSRAGSFPAFS
jgi:hypothetical protein